jgi:hypothetical protein
VGHHDANYQATHATVRAGFDPFEQRELAEQPLVDRIASILWRHNHTLATWWITEMSGNYGTEAYTLAQSLLTQISPPATP